MAKSVLQDPFLAQNLPWKYIDDLLIMDLLQPQPRRNLHENGVLDIDAIDGTTFYRNFRFHKGDLDDLIVGLLIPGEVLRDLKCGVQSNVSHRTWTPACRSHGSWLDEPPEPATVFTVEHQEGAPLKNCWGFIDGTARRICRPSKLQQEHYSGHKRFYCQKYQAVMCANGIVCQLDGPFRGRRHDADLAIVDFHKKMKVTRQRVGRMYKVATLLTNCRTCLYDSQVFMFFGLEPRSLSDYLIPFN
ncbi:hypothetical protein MRX96_032331 [Rhipicephalus microplus]